MKRYFKNKYNISFTIALAIATIAYILFVTSLINKNPNLLFASGIILMLAFFALIIIILINPHRATIFDWVSIIFYSVAGIILLVAYISAIPNDEMRSVVTAISSSIIGGILTLFGVAITIKYNRLSKEEDERNKCKPRIYPISKSTWKQTRNKDYRIIETKKWNTDLKKADKKDKSFSIESIYIANSDISMCTYDGLMVNEHVLMFDNGLVLQKDFDYELQHNIIFELDEDIKCFSLLLTDMLDNTYRAIMEIEKIEHGKTKIITVKSVLKTILYATNNSIDVNDILSESKRETKHIS